MNVLRVLISAGALSFLFWKIGLGETLAVLRRANLRYLVAAFLLFVLSLGIRAYRWLVLLRSLDPGVPFARLLRLYSSDSSSAVSSPVNSVAMWCGRWN